MSHFFWWLALTIWLVLLLWHMWQIWTWPTNASMTYESLTAWCSVLHAVLVLFQATTLNVAFNSHNKALLTIMMSNNVSSPLLFISLILHQPPVHTSLFDNLTTTYSSQFWHSTGVFSLFISFADLSVSKAHHINNIRHPYLIIPVNPSISLSIHYGLTAAWL